MVITDINKNPHECIVDTEHIVVFRLPKDIYYLYAFGLTGERTRDVFPVTKEVFEKLKNSVEDAIFVIDVETTEKMRDFIELAFLKEVADDITIGELLELGAKDDNK